MNNYDKLPWDPGTDVVGQDVQVLDRGMLVSFMRVILQRTVHRMHKFGVTNDPRGWTKGNP